MFGANLRQLAKSYPSISQLSRKLGINRTQFNRYLSGESFPRPDVLDRICSFFDMDARILLEPVDNLINTDQILNGAFLSDFLGCGVLNLEEDLFPSGFYRFTRRSFVDTTQYVMGLIYVFRNTDGATYIKGFEAKDAMAFQGLPTDQKTREFRGFVTSHEDGIAFVLARRKTLTYSFNYLARAASMENNFWAGYVARTTRESEHGERVTRMVYEHLGTRTDAILMTARNSGFVTYSDLIPFHRHLLHAGESFR